MNVTNKIAHRSVQFRLRVYRDMYARSRHFLAFANMHKSREMRGVALKHCNESRAALRRTMTEALALLRGV